MQVFDASNKVVSQCHKCRDYFEQQKYFKANSDCMGKFALVKSNSPIKIENGGFKIMVKMMCCCAHHNVESFAIVITCSSFNSSNAVSFIARSNINVKQWRKSNQKKEEPQFVLVQANTA